MNSVIVQGWQTDVAVAGIGASAGGDLLVVALRDAATGFSVVGLRVDLTPDAKSAPTAAVLWSIEIPDGDVHTVGPYRFGSTPSVIVGVGRAHLVVGRRRVLVDLAQGTVLAETLSANLPSGPARVVNDRLFVPETVELAVYDATTLDPVARAAAPEGLWTQSVSPNAEVCALRSLTADAQEEHAALWHLDRNELWHLEGHRNLIVGGLLAVDHAVLVATSEFGPCADRVRAINTMTGRTLWNTKLPGVEADRYGPQAYHPSETLLRLPTAVSVMSDGQSIVVVGSADGRVTRTVPLTDAPTVQASVGNRLWVGTEDGRVVVVDPDAGTIIDDHETLWPAARPQWPVAIFPTSASRSTALVLGGLGSLCSVTAP